MWEVKQAARMQVPSATVMLDAELLFRLIHGDIMRRNATAPHCHLTEIQAMAECLRGTAGPLHLVQRDQSSAEDHPHSSAPGEGHGSGEAEFQGAAQDGKHCPVPAAAAAADDDAQPRTDGASGQSITVHSLVVQQSQPQSKIQDGSQPCFDEALGDSLIFNSQAGPAAPELSRRGAPVNPRGHTPLLHTTLLARQAEAVTNPLRQQHSMPQQAPKVAPQEAPI